MFSLFNMIEQMDVHNLLAFPSLEKRIRRLLKDLFNQLVSMGLLIAEKGASGEIKGML